MNKVQVQVIFAIIYIVVDICYVALSKNVYDKTVVNIQGTHMPVRILTAMSAWLCMAIAWFFITTTLVDIWKTKGYSPVSAALIAGFITGLTMYGTFNFTVRAMFINYDVPLMVRDMIWGIGWITTLTVIYSLMVDKL